MKLRGKRRRAQAEVIGALFSIVLAIIVFSLFTALMAAQYSMAKQAADTFLPFGVKPKVCEAQYSMAKQAADTQLVAGEKADESLSVSLRSEDGDRSQQRSDDRSDSLLRWGERWRAAGVGPGTSCHGSPTGDFVIFS